MEFKVEDEADEEADKVGICNEGGTTVGATVATGEDVADDFDAAVASEGDSKLRSNCPERR